MIYQWKTWKPDLNSTIYVDNEKYFLTGVYTICKIKKWGFMACVNVGLRISNKDNSLLGFSIT